jgi:hypothetical protein
MKLQRSLTIIILLLVLLSYGCGQKPPSTLSVGDIKPDNTARFTVGSEKPLSVNASGSGLRFSWTTTGGQFIGGIDTPGVLFRAPNQPGKVIVSVRVNDANGQEETRTVDFNVDALPTAVSNEAAVPPIVQMPTLTEGTQSLAPTPLPLLIDSMDDFSAWETSYCDAECGGDNGASSIQVSRNPGRFGSAIQIKYDVKQDGYVLITRSLEEGLLEGFSGVSFYFKGSGQANTLETKLLFSYPGESGDTAYGFMVHDVTDTHDAWMKMEIPIQLFSCWWPPEHCEKYGEALADFSHLKRIDFAVANKKLLIDEAGEGFILIDQVERMP